MPRSLLLLALLLCSCVTGPTDLQPIDWSTSRTFTGYSRTPSSPVRAFALNQKTGQWIQVGSAVATSVADVPAGVWGGNSALYSWTINASLSTSADRLGLCFLGPQCTPRIGSLGSSTIHVKLEEGSTSAPVQLIVFDQFWSSCMGQRITRGETFDLAAIACRAPSYPELRLRVIEDWANLPSGGPSGTPAITSNGDLFITVASAGPSLRYSMSPALGQWGTWRTIPGPPTSGFPLENAPIFMRRSGPTTILEVYAIAGNGLMYRAAFDPVTATFGTMSSVPGISGASGRLTGIPNGEVYSFAYSAGPHNTQVSIFNLAGTLLATRNFPGDEIAISWDAPDIGFFTLLTIRDGTTFSFHRFHDLFEGVAVLGSIDAGPFDDWHPAVTDVEASHFFIARPTSFGYGEIVDHRFERAPPSFGVPPFVLTSRVAGTYALGGPVRIAAIGPYKTLVWTDPTPGLKSARWIADGPGYWLSMTAGTTGSLARRPALFQNRFHGELRGEAMNPSAYTNEIEVAAAGADGVVRFGSLTKMTLRGELEKTFDIYETSTGGGCSSDPAVPDAAWLEDLAAQDRIMFGTLADEFVRIPPGWDHAFRAQAAWECVTGPVQPASVNRACELAKYPLVISTVPVDAYRCSDGVYLYRRADPTSYVWAALARALGFNDNGVLPSPRNVDLSAISLASLQEGAAIFREGTGMTCQDHCPGFVSGTEPETNGPEEAFSWALWYYAVSGQAFRADAVQGLASHPCNDLMARKYDWLKANIFHGNENFRFIAGPAETLGRCN